VMGLWSRSSGGDSGTKSTASLQLPEPEGKGIVNALRHRMGVRLILDFLRHLENLPRWSRKQTRRHAYARRRHRSEFSTGYSSAGCFPAEPASASPDEAMESGVFRTVKRGVSSVTASRML
jgi:hypothetical protein